MQIGEITWEEFEKVGLHNFYEFAKKKQKKTKTKQGWKWRISLDSAQFTKRVDIWFLNVQQNIWELRVKTHFPWLA